MYTITSGYGQNFARSVSDDVIGGPPRTNYFTPTNFQATNHTCNEIELTWDNSSIGSETQSFYIENLQTGESYLPGKSQNSFLIQNNIQEQYYIYSIQSVNNCQFKSDASYDTSNFETLQAVTSLSTSLLPSGSIKLNWSPASGVQHYKVVKTFSGGGIETFDQIHKDSTYYVDDNTQACINYTYRIYRANDCHPNGIVGAGDDYKIIPGLDSTFVTNNFNVSKGDFYRTCCVDV